MYLKNLDHEIKIRISNILYDRLVNLSVVRNVSVSECVRNILSQYLALEVIHEYTKSD